MTLKQSSSPYGYKNLLVYKKAEELQRECARLTSRFPHSKTLYSLADQMDRSARSVKQNIVEGWKRNSTKEYHQFLGFSLGANAELEEDCNDIVKGVYKGLKGVKGVEWGEWEIERVEKLPFYPLDPHLPPLVQLKLRCKELNMLIGKLQKSLDQKMREPAAQIFASAWGESGGKSGDRFLEEMMEKGGYVRLRDGRVVKREEGEKSI